AASTQGTPQLVAVDTEPRREIDFVETIEQRQTMAPMFHDDAALFEGSRRRGPTPKRTPVVDVYGQHGFEVAERSVWIVALEHDVAEQAIGDDEAAAQLVAIGIDLRKRKHGLRKLDPGVGIQRVHQLPGEGE